jgi:hypothetical protein
MDEKHKDECQCGSGRSSFAIYDGYGIFLGRVCEECEHELVKKFRKDIFENYDCDEPIDPYDYH